MDIDEEARARRGAAARDGVDREAHWSRSKTSKHPRSAVLSVDLPVWSWGSPAELGFCRGAGCVLSHEAGVLPGGDACALCSLPDSVAVPLRVALPLTRARD